MKNNPIITILLIISAINGESYCNLQKSYVEQAKPIAQKTCNFLYEHKKYTALIVIGLIALKPTMILARFCFSKMPYMSQSSRNNDLRIIFQKKFLREDDSKKVNYLIAIGADRTIWQEYLNRKLAETVNDNPYNTQEINQLLSQGADPNSCWNNEPLLILAIHKNKFLLHYLLQAKADINILGLATEYEEFHQRIFPQFTNTRQTPLMYAAAKGNIEMVTLLLNAGADINKQNDEGFTALFYACTFLNTSIMRLLLDAGANSHIRDFSGLTCSQQLYSIFRGIPSTVELRWDRKASVNKDYFKISYEKIIQFIEKIHSLQSAHISAQTMESISPGSTAPGASKIKNIEVLIADYLMPLTTAEQEQKVTASLTLP